MYQGAKLVPPRNVTEVLLQHLEDPARVTFVLEALAGQGRLVFTSILHAQAGQDAHFRLTLSGV